MAIYRPSDSTKCAEHTLYTWKQVKETINLSPSIPLNWLILHVNDKINYQENWTLMYLEQKNKVYWKFTLSSCQYFVR